MDPVADEFVSLSGDPAPVAAAPTTTFLTTQPTDRAPVISVFLRYDDYSAISSLPLEAGLVAVLRRHSCSATFGVIPAVTTGEYHIHGEREEVLLDGEKADWLRDRVREGTVDLGLHGWNHRTGKLSPPPVPSEYRGLAFEVQLANVQRGMEHLETVTGRRPTIFIPPWNSYDENTVRVLTTCEFACLSAARTGPSSNSSSLQYLPVVCELHEVHAAVVAARARGDHLAIIGVLMHPYDFRESDDPRARLDLAGFEALLAQLGSMSDVQLTSIPALLLSTPKLDAERHRANGPAVLDSIAPAKVRRLGSLYWYASTGVARRTARLRVTATLVYYLAIAGLSWALGSLLARLLPGMLGPLAWGVGGVMLLGVLGISVRAAMNGRLFARGMTVISSHCGFLTGFLPW